MNYSSLVRPDDFDVSLIPKETVEFEGGEFYLSHLFPKVLSVPATGKVIPLSYAERPYLTPIIDSFTSLKKVFLIFGRQTEKSTSVAACQLGLTGTVPMISWQYVSATMKQAREFSHWKLDNMIRLSPTLQRMYDRSGARMTYNLQEKVNAINSRVLVATAFGDAARVRGVSADALSIDEVELVELEAIPVLQECMSHSDMKYELHAATPLSTENTAWIMWQDQSHQYEWLVPCHRHGFTQWHILGPQNLTTTGVICDKCGHPLNVLEGQWQCMLHNPKASLHSFRLPQIATPFADHRRIAQNLVDKPMETLRESFALSTEESEQVFGGYFLKSLCRENDRLEPEQSLRTLGAIYPLSAGIDWAQGGTSATVVVFGTTVQSEFRWIAGYRFVGAGEREFRQIMNLLEEAKPHRIVADFGAGHIRNRKLMEKFGYPRFMVSQYVRQKNRLVFDPKAGRLMVDRNNVIDDVVSHIQIHPDRFSFPNRRYMERTHWWADMMAVRVELDKHGRSQYVRRSTETDDFFHASLYCLIASNFVQPRPDIFGPVLVKPGAIGKLDDFEAGEELFG